MKYEEYKDSGVERIGRIPNHWEVKRLKFLSQFINGFAFKSDTFSDDAEFPVIRIGDICNEKISYDDVLYIDKQNSLKGYEVACDDILIAMSGATVGKVGLCTSEDRGYINQRVGILRSDRYMSIWYNLLSPIFLEYIYLMSDGSAQPNISTTGIKNYYIALPPLPEQQAIVNYLDAKCAKINGSIDVQKRKIELLNELKQTIITNAVTKGLNPDAPMKDSGVEWIGQVPEHWEVMKMNFACKVITDYVASGSFADLRNNVTYLDEPDFAMLVRTADLSQKDKNISRVYINKASYDFLSNSNLFGGEIVLPNIGASIGDVYMVPYGLYDNMSLAPNSIMVKSKTSDEYMYYFFFSKVGRESLNIIGTAAAQGKFNKTELRALRVPIPPSEEQDLIINHIKEKIAPIETQISKANQRIELLNELKQSIITEAVTGKIKVC